MQAVASPQVSIRVLAYPARSPARHASSPERHKSNDEVDDKVSVDEVALIDLDVRDGIVKRRVEDDLLVKLHNTARIF